MFPRVRVAMLAAVLLVAGTLAATAASGTAASGTALDTATATAALGTDTATATATATAALDTALESPTSTAAPSAGAINWKGCGGGFECVRLRVPVDYAQPDGEQVGISMIRDPAPGSAHHRSLVVNFGGPGDAGTESLPSFVDYLPREIHKRFDIVSFDPRGIGRSRPVDCVDDSDADKLAAEDPTADTAAELRAFYDGTTSTVDLVQGCITRNGAWLAQIGTRNVARDLDRIRAGLGNDTLDFLGYSYGTVIAAVYAQMFPERVGRFVLDSPVNLSVTPEQELLDDANGFEHALDTFLADCARRADCSFHENGDPAGALTRLQQHFEGGLTLPGGGSRKERSARPVGVGEFYTALISALYDKEYGWPELADALHAASAKQNGALLQALADSYNGRQPDGTYDNIDEVIGIILCDDRADPVPTFGQFTALHDRLVAAYPILGGDAGSTPLGCDPRLPLPPASETVGDVRVPNAAPVLVVGTTDDPATPYSGAVDTSARLAGSRLLTFVSTEHTAYTKSACIDDAVDAYLLRGTLPPVGTRCRS